MMCVPNVTVPERTAVPPELWKARVTSSHQRWAVGVRTGVPQVRVAGVAGAVVGLAVGVGDGERPGLRPDLASGGEEAGVDAGPGPVPVPGVEVPLAVGDLGASSGTSVTLPVGRAAVADGRGGPTAA